MKRTGGTMPEYLALLTKVEEGRSFRYEKQELNQKGRNKGVTEQKLRSYR